MESQVVFILLTDKRYDVKIKLLPTTYTTYCNYGLIRPKKQFIPMLYDSIKFTWRTVLCSTSRHLFYRGNKSQTHSSPKDTHVQLALLVEPTRLTTLSPAGSLLRPAEAGKHAFHTQRRWRKLCVKAPRHGTIVLWRPPKSPLACAHVRNGESLSLLNLRVFVGGKPRKCRCSYSTCVLHTV